jgi:hypothetical protein
MSTYLNEGKVVVQETETKVCVWFFVGIILIRLLFMFYYLFVYAIDDDVFVCFPCSICLSGY